jgi:hypothetical protein
MFSTCPFAFTFPATAFHPIALAGPNALAPSQPRLMPRAIENTNMAEADVSS